MAAEAQRLKAAFHYVVGCLCENVAEEKEIQFSKQTIAAIAEITFRQCEIFAKDLEMFAKHAKRSTVNCEDVKLLARRSSSLIRPLMVNLGTPAVAELQLPASLIIDDEAGASWELKFSISWSAKLKYITQKSDELSLNNLEQKEKRKKKSAAKKGGRNSDEFTEPMATENEDPNMT